jgi:hypothetical protein
VISDRASFAFVSPFPWHHLPQITADDLVKRSESDGEAPIDEEENREENDFGPERSVSAEALTSVSEDDDWVFRSCLSPFGIPFRAKEPHVGNRETDWGDLA